jgi:hypothetical protein
VLRCWGVGVLGSWGLGVLGFGVLESWGVGGEMGGSVGFFVCGPGFLLVNN